MVDSKPIVRGGLLYDPDLPKPLSVLSDEFQKWLTDHRSFFYESDVGNLSCYKDKRGYWTASHSIKGRKYKTRLPLPITERKLFRAIRSSWKRHKDGYTRAEDELLCINDPIELIHYLQGQKPPRSIVLGLEKLEMLILRQSSTKSGNPRG